MRKIRKYWQKKYKNVNKKNTKIQTRKFRKDRKGSKTVKKKKRRKEVQKEESREQICRINTEKKMRIKRRIRKLK